jgi:PKHD-type hydroxylase
VIVLPAVLTPDELKLVREFLDQAEFDDGKLTASGIAAARKNNLQAARARDPEGHAAVDKLVVAGLQRHPLFAAYAWPRRVTAPLYARYDPGMQYGAHVDGAIMAADGLRTDLSVTLFLAEPAEYDGGELSLDLGGGAVHSVKLPGGAAFVYPTGALHLVRPVTAGRRLVAVFWVQSYARDQGVRELLFDLRAVASSLNQQAPQSREAQLVLKSLSNLERRFAEP